MVRARALTTPAVYFLPHAVAPILCESFSITGPNFFIGRLGMTRPPSRPALPSRNFLITYRIAYARIHGWGTRAHDALYTFYHVRWRPCSVKTSSSQAPILCSYLWYGHPPSRPAVCILPRTVAPLFWENFLIAGPPKILHQNALVGAPALPPTLPSRNFQITGRTFYAPYLRLGHPPWRTAV